VLALTLVAAAGLLGLAAAPASAAQDVAVSLTSMTPTVATSSSQELSLAGNLTIPSGTEHSDVIVQLGFEAVSYRSAMTGGPDPGGDTDFNAVQDQLGTLSAGSYPWALKTPLSAMGLSADTVYAIDVQAWSNGEYLGAQRTYLPYKIGSGSSPVSTTQLTVLAPVTATSSADGYQESIDGTTYPELTEQTLASEMGSGGNLYKLLVAGAQLPKGTISWAVDPDLLNTAMAIQNGYLVAASGSSTPDVGPNPGNARAWLKEAKNVLGGTNGELWQLPATDPDLGSLSNASTKQAEQLLGDAANESTKSSTVKTLVGRIPQGLLAWPAGGQVSSTTLNLADSFNPTAVIVDSTSIGLSVSHQRYTPTGRASANGRGNLAVGDTALDAIMSGDSVDSGSSVLAGQRLLAQTALISRENPNLSRSIMLTLPRDAATEASDMGILKVLQSASWVSPSGLSSLLAKSADPAASTGTPTRSSSVSGTDLSSGQISSVTGLQSQLKLFQSILTQTDATTAGFAEAVLRTVSTSWRGSSASWKTFESAVSNRLGSQTGKVYLIPKSDLTLSGTSGSIPFTVVNQLPQEVKLGLEVQTSPSGLSVTQIPVRVFVGGSTTVEVKVSTKVASSTYRVTAFLVTPDGAHYGTAKSGGSQSLQVTVTSIGFVALLLFAGSAALLVFAVGLRIYRGRKGSRSEPATREGD
jgi:hypothetical protein